MKNTYLGKLENQLGRRLRQEEQERLRECLDQVVLEEDVQIVKDKKRGELTNNVNSKKMTPTLIRIEASGKTNSIEGLANAEKFIYVLEGEIILNINKNTFLLKQNNSIYFKSSSKHFFENKIKKSRNHVYR